MSKTVFNSYGLASYNGKTIIMLLAPYAPFADLGEGYLPVDACYPCANAVHKEVKRLIARLKKEGIAAEEFTEPVYTRLAFEAGLACAKGKNSLAYNKEFGSRFVLGAIQIPDHPAPTGEYAWAPLHRGELTELSSIFVPNLDLVKEWYKRKDISVKSKFPSVEGWQPQADGVVNGGCSSCNACAAACPTGAIGENGLNPEKCLRWHMRTGEYPDGETAKAAGNAFWGCDICQRVCPMNNAECRTQNAELKKWLLISDFLKNPKEHTKKLGEIIGANYANVSRLLALCINAAGNSGNKEYAPLIEQYLNSKSRAVKIAADAHNINTR